MSILDKIPGSEATWIKICFGLMVIFVLVLFTGFSNADPVTWNYSVPLPATADSITINYWHDMDSVNWSTLTGTDSLWFNWVTDDSGVNWIDAFIWYDTTELAPVSYRDYLHKEWVARGDSVWWRIQVSFAEPVATLIRVTYLNYALHSWVSADPAATIDTFLAVSSHTDSLYASDTDMVQVTFHQDYGDGSQRVGFVEHFPSMAFSITDTVATATDTLYINPITGGVTPFCTVFIVYRRLGSAYQGALVSVRNENVAYDTTTGTQVGPFKKYAWTNASGVAEITVPRSYIFSDSLQGLYDISIQYGGRTVKTWDDFWVPDQDTVRLGISE